MSAVTIANIPSALKSARTWCVWRLEPPETEGKKWKKMPRTVTGGHGDSTNPAKWVTGQEAYDAYAKSQGNKEPFTGIGFVFYRNSPIRYTGLDFDGWTWEKVQPLVEKLLPAYVEVSQSGQGIHVIVKGTLPPEAGGGKKDSKSGIEVYDDERYFAITGNVPAGHDGDLPDLETDRTPELAEFFAQHLAHLVKGKAAEQHGTTVPLTSEAQALIHRILPTKDGRRLHTLFQSGEPNEFRLSEADYDLACILCRATPDDDLVERVMRSSALQREKWDKHRTYLRELTIADARVANPGPIEMGGEQDPLDLTALELSQNPELLKVPASQSPWLVWRGEYSILVGREKLAGKSTLAGSDAVGALKAGLRVLWVTAEESQNRVLTRFTDLQAPLANLILLRRWPQSWEEVEDVIRRRQPDLIYVDSQASFLMAVDGEVPQTSELEKWQSKGLRFKRWASLVPGHLAGVVVLVHATKGDGTYAGSVGIGAAADTIITMRTAADRPNDRLLDKRGRWGFPSQTLRFMDAVQGYVDAPDEGAVAPTKEAKPLKGEMLRMVTALKSGMTYSKWEEAYGGNPNTFKSYVERLKDRGAVTQDLATGTWAPVQFTVEQELVA